ncbi:MlaD family protein [Neolewinella antarctica]|uniref:ABC-type transporter Mla subunit MlaD n=1 Tax=Neolewinella antarctica TaxID=442734 RepID=A0ABX0XGP6_9BACT|nr:MlaD family protein [Neolewinella antarctica]NJC28511.1 ABC-type transporter Mla subunit MlaD [Neolewinella antarctica]
MKMIMTLMFVVFLASCNNSSTLYFKTVTAVGISTKMDVSTSGIKIGSVENIDLQPDRSVLITLRVDPEIRIPNDAVVSMKKIDLFGKHELSIDGGVENNYFVSGDTIQYAGVVRTTSDSVSIKLIKELFRALGDGPKADSMR